MGKSINGRSQQMIRMCAVVAVLIVVLFTGVYHLLSTTRFDSKLNLSIRKNDISEWQKELQDVSVGDIVQLQAEFINSRGFLSTFLGKIAANNDLDITTGNIMIRSVLPDSLEYVENSTILFNSNYQNGIKIRDNTINTSGINIGSYEINGNAYIRFSCRVIDRNLQKGNNKCITWVSSTIKDKVEKDSVSVWVNYNN